MDIARAQEFLRAAELCLQIGLVHSALVVRQAADYGRAGVSYKIAQRHVRRGALFVTAVREVLGS
jgi:hypothetical protein